ncbi:hypothetical protein [Okeania hirsuta]|nr:hypothetical protein [Okeania hirsuta]
MSKGCLLKIIFIPLTIRNILFSKWYIEEGDRRQETGDRRKITYG